MLELAERQGLQIVGTFSEAKSAKEPYVREQFNEMIKQINAGKANGILVWKMDRLARNSVDEGTVKYLLQKGIIQNIKSTDRDWYPDDNVLLASVEFGVATQYSRDLAKHIKRGLRARLEAGVRPSIAPLGYRNSKYHEKGKEEILVDEERFHLVRKIFDTFITGRYTPFQMLDMASEWGLTVKATNAYPEKKISKTYMYTLLSNPFYYGDFEYPLGSGNWYHGSHQPMITKEEYDKVQWILSGKKGSMRPKTHKFKYTGIMRCGECGAFITAEAKVKHQKNGKIHHYTYYHCTKRVNADCQQKCVSETELERQIVGYLQKITVSKEFHEWAMNELKEIDRGSSAEKEKHLAIKRKAFTDCQNKLDALLQLRMDGEIDAEQYKEKKAQFEKEQFELRQYLENAEKAEKEWLEGAEQTLTFAERAVEEFKEGDFEKRRAILQSVGTNHKLLDRRLTIETHKPLEIFSVVKDETDQITAQTCSRTESARNC